MRQKDGKKIDKNFSMKVKIFKYNGKILFINMKHPQHKIKDY